MGILIIIYSTTQFISFWSGENYSITEKNLYKALENESVSKSQGFAIAAALVGLEKYKSSEVAEIGQINFYMKSWNNPWEDPKFH